MKPTLNSELWELIERLNTKETLPETGLRRNSIYYPFISYINHTIALLLSGSYDEAALFIRRARREMQSRNFERTEYILICQTYLSQLQAYLKKHKLLSPIWEEWLNEE